MGKLTATRLRTLKAPGMYGDGVGLYLKIGRGDARSWIQRIKYGGRRRDIGLGRFPDVGLAQAREAAARNRALIASGGDPLAEKRRTNVPTFCEAAERVFEANRPRWRNVKHTVTWLQSLERHAYPVLGNMPVDTINQEDVLRVLMPIWGTTPETARRVRQRIRTILKWAQAHRFVEHNAAGEVIDGALPAMPKVKNHLRALPYQEVGGSVEAVRQSQASLAVKWCLEFLILTAVRSGEARGAAWSEIDMDAATWTVPAARMKANAEHRVPLCGRALEILEEARAIEDGSGLVFPSPSQPGRPAELHSPDCGVAPDRGCRPGDGPRFPQLVPRLCRRMHQRAIRGHGAEPCPRCRQRSCGILRAFRSARTPPWAHGSVGGLPGRGHWACRADGPGA